MAHVRRPHLNTSSAPTWLHFINNSQNKQLKIERKNGRTKQIGHNGCQYNDDAQQDEWHALPSSVTTEMLFDLITGGVELRIVAKVIVNWRISRQRWHNRCIRIKRNILSVNSKRCRVISIIFSSSLERLTVLIRIERIGNSHLILALPLANACVYP